MYGIYDTRTTRAARWLSDNIFSWPGKLLKFFFIVMAAVVGTLVGYADVVLRWIFRAALACPFAWLGWNYGAARLLGAGQAGWATAFFCCLAVVPFIGPAK